MIHEKIFNLAVDREAQIIVKGSTPNNSRQINIDFEFLIKDKNERYFRSPIGINHPQYWKMKRSTPQQAKLLLMEYSGVSQRQVNQALTEFNRIVNYHPAQIGLHYESELL